MQHSQNFVDEGLGLAGLLHDEVATTLLCDLDERITRHVLYT